MIQRGVDDGSSPTPSKSFHRVRAFRTRVYPAARCQNLCISNKQSPCTVIRWVFCVLNTSTRHDNKTKWKYPVSPKLSRKILLLMRTVSPSVFVSGKLGRQASQPGEQAWLWTQIQNWLLELVPTLGSWACQGCRLCLFASSSWRVMELWFPPAPAGCAHTVMKRHIFLEWSLHFSSLFFSLWNRCGLSLGEMSTSSCLALAGRFSFEHLVQYQFGV